MPELPEIEVTRRDMEREVAGKKFKSVEMADKKMIAPHKTKAEFAERIEGHKAKSFDRRGSYIVGKLDSGELWVIDLGATGRMQRVKGGKPAADDSTMLTIPFTTGGAVRLNDPKGAARTWVTTKEDFEALPEILEPGIDPLESPVPWQTFGQVLLANPKSKLKALLQNPRIVAGLGPVYSDEVLFNAGLMYDRTSDTLSAHEVRRLYRGMIETLTDAIKYRGVSYDENEVDMYGEPGEYSQYVQVYLRVGEPCRRCRAPIERVKFQKRYHYFCANCQS